VTLGYRSPRNPEVRALGWIYGRRHNYCRDWHFMLLPRTAALSRYDVSADKEKY